MRDEEIPNWLKELPLAPVFYPTDTEFADPVAYISKIEKEASAYGMCKVIPPLPKPSKKYVVGNLNKSLLKCPELGNDVKLNNVETINDGEVRAVFTTRHQELGHSSVKRTKEVGAGAGTGQPPPVNKQVWQSGEIYTLEQFESKSKNFARSHLSTIKEVSPLAIESLFWKAALEKPIYIEYANDVPGSGFGEPVGPARLVHRHRRRRKTFDRNNKDCCDVRSEVEDKSNNCENQKGEESVIIRCSPSSSSVDMLKKDTNSRVSDEVEGSSGWKLSNCPWNLQVIARSPGSLTRFMPDDIPGVTSPMVYIGMLFSWFAWHVEDHELHSLNFLHIGSPKTWYAVPGDYAFTFEEVIRSKAYGGGVDRLAALTLLGEKTTLLSPETVVASGIPCCRLVQNPGEFVVTFPRAYHIGFSHGFNCGEAANFGTPKWLSVAKEAAVRRAAMNFLPMLSHQQLLYLLTMSFIPRVPRSLLPGIRSSRLKNRQKEERELLVKKEFIEDILKENKLLTCILNRSSSYHAVLWDLESLSPSVINNNNNPPTEGLHVEKDKETGVHVEDEDMSSDFQIDSGTLPCVACGVLGYPFMSVIQPSPKVLFDNMPIKYIASSETPVVNNNAKDESLEEASSTCSSDNGWNLTNGYLRPRIFCLEHASKIQELLESIGGAKLLIICHSDFLKIKAQVSAIGEEIVSMFRYEDVELEDASRDDVEVINLAIDNEEEDECLQDWTLKLNVNLRESVKLSCPNKSSSHIHSALTMDALFADTSPTSTSTSSSVVSQITVIQWQATKSRSNRKSNRSIKKSSDTVSVTEDVKLKEKLSESEAQMPKKEGKFIQYSRRSFKSKPQDSVTNCGKNTNKVVLDDSIPSQKHKHGYEKCGVENSSGSVSCATTIEKDEEMSMQNENEKDSGNECSRREVNEDGLMETDPSIESKKSQINDAKDENTPVSSCFTSTSGKSKRKREVEQSDFDGFIRSPCEGLRPRGGNTEKPSISKKAKASNVKEKSTNKSKSCSKVNKITGKEEQGSGSGSGSHRCDHEGCKLSFGSKTELGLHRKNRCPHDGCGKKFSSHRYAVLHLRVHEDSRPLKCTWKGCKMTFKWAWARTEHLRVHTGERPYKCPVEGCERTFRFVSDYSRHRRKTGHNVHVKSKS